MAFYGTERPAWLIGVFRSVTPRDSTRPDARRHHQALVLRKPRTSRDRVYPSMGPY